jgi:hypothetical protein
MNRPPFLRFARPPNFGPRTWKPRMPPPRDETAATSRSARHRRWQADHPAPRSARHRRDFSELLSSSADEAPRRRCNGDRQRLAAGCRRASPFPGRERDQQGARSGDSRAAWDRTETTRHVAQAAFSVTYPLLLWPHDRRSCPHYLPRNRQAAPDRTFSSCEPTRPSASTTPRYAACQGRGAEPCRRITISSRVEPFLSLRQELPARF